MPMSEQEADRRLKALQKLYNLDDQGKPIPYPAEGTEKQPLPTQPPQSMVRAMNEMGDIVDVPESEARKKGYYILPPVTR